MIQCPQCFTEIAGQVNLYACTGACPEIVDTRYTAWFGRERRSKPLTVVLPPEDPNQARRWVAPETTPCRNCRAAATRVCQTCHYQLPDGWLAGTAVLIALAGPRSTGKSVYLGVLVQKLAQLAEALGSNLGFVGRTRDTYEEVYEKALFVARQMLEPTGAATTDSYQNDPMIFTLGRLNKAKQERFVVIRDIAGEDLERNFNKQYVQFFKNASLVLFHFDPTQIPEVQNELRGITTDLNEVGGSPSTVLENLLKILGSSRPKLAVTLSKFDALQLIGRGANGGQAPAAGDRAGEWAHRMTNPGAAFNREARAPWTYDEEDGLLLHEEVRSLLAKLDAQGLINQLENPTGAPIPHRFFVTSALGEPPMNRRTNPRGIAPFRVLDPIKWALSEANFIDMHKESSRK